MTIDEAIYHLQELADSKFEQMRRYDRASGYAISHNEDIRTADAKRLEQRAKECIQLAKWLRELKRYKQAFGVACELLNDCILYGYDTDRIFEIMMERDGVVDAESYEKFILDHLSELRGEEK